MKKFALLAMLILFIIPASAQTVISPVLEQQLIGIETFISQRRELPILTPVIRQFPTREEAIAFLVANTEEELPPEDANREGLFYRALGFIPADFELRQFIGEFLGDQVAGYYNTQDKTMNTILFSGGELGDSLPFFEQVIYAHEFTHALQDQHFDLQTLFESIDANADQASAVQALIEGDATYMMQAYTFYAIQNNLVNPAEALSADIDTDTPEGTPQIFISEVNFAYLEGLTFINTIQGRGGWNAVNDAFANLPQSTEQILHPQKYIDGEAPIVVELADMLPILGDGWEYVVTRTVGEFYLREYLDIHLRAPIARDAATGWGGDSMAIYYHPDTNSVAWMMGIAWDAPVLAEQDQFIDAYAEFLDAIFDEFTDEGGICGFSDELAICFANTPTTTFIASAPTVEQAQVMLAVMLEEAFQTVE